MRFSLMNCDAIGFDVDHTLCRYKVDEQIELGYRAMAQYLVTNKGYPKDLLRPVQDDAWMCFNGGLVFDVEYGHFLKLDKDGVIVRASHGMRFMSDPEILKFYNDRKWKHFAKMQEGVSSEAGVYHFYDNNFDVTGIVLLSRMIEYHKQKPGATKQSTNSDSSNKKHSGKGVWNDCVSAVEDSWKPCAFKAGSSGYFTAVEKNPEKYLIRCPDKVHRWLDELKNRGKTLFIITSSHCDYASHVLDYCFGEIWRDYFDLFISTAGKPRFFTHQAPFLAVDHKTMTVGGPVETLKKKEWYSEGNAIQLMRTLRDFTGLENPKVSYFGDSLRSDVIPSDISFNWEAIYVMELLGVRGNGSSVDESTGADNKNDALPQSVENLLLSDRWGPVLSCRGASDMMSSYFADVIRKHSTVAIYCLETMADKPVDYSYDTVSCSDALRGFYSDVPSVLYK